MFVGGSLSLGNTTPTTLQDLRRATSLDGWAVGRQYWDTVDARTYQRIRSMRGLGDSHDPVGEEAEMVFLNKSVPYSYVRLLREGIKVEKY